MGRQTRFFALISLILMLFGVSQASSAAPTTIPITGNLSQISGSPGAYTGISIELVNCPSPASIAGYYGIVQTGYQLMADSSGLVNGSVWPNDLIDCNGTTGNSQYQLTYLVNGTPAGTPQCYQVASGTVWNISTIQPITCTQTPPNPQDATYNNVVVNSTLSASTVSAATITDTGLTPGTGMICPNGPGGALTTSGCAGATPGVPTVNSSPDPVVISGPGVSCSIASGVQTCAVSDGGTGSGTVNPAPQYAIPYYPNTVSSGVISGTGPFSGIVYASTSAPPAAATGAQIASTLGSTAVNFASEVFVGALGTGYLYLLGSGADTTTGFNTGLLLSSYSAGPRFNNTLGSLDVPTGYTIAGAAAPLGHFLRGDGGAFVDGTIQPSDVPIPTLYTVATLPACAAGNKGQEWEVTDASGPTYLGALTGGGSVLTPVVCNGTAWVSY